MIRLPPISALLSSIESSDAYLKQLPPIQGEVVDLKPPEHHQIYTFTRNQPQPTIMEPYYPHVSNVSGYYPHAVVLRCSSCGVSSSNHWTRGVHDERLCSNCAQNLNPEPFKPIHSSDPRYSVVPDEKRMSPVHPSYPPMQPVDSLKSPERVNLDPKLFSATRQPHNITTNKRKPPKKVRGGSNEVYVNKAGEAMICNNCDATQTPMWRRDEEGKPICNACGLYKRIHGKKRPRGMKKSDSKKSAEPCQETVENTVKTGVNALMMLVDAAEQL